MKKIIFPFFAIAITTFTHSQNVGIGTTIPKHNLHVHKSSGPGSSDVSINITNNITGDGFISGVRLRMLDNDFDIINNQATGTLGFTTGGFQRLLIKPNGNIGINNTDPQTVLHINARPFPATNYNEAIRIGGTTPYISFYDDAVLKGYMQASLGGFEIGTKSAQTLNFFTNDLQRMTIANNGDIGMGIITPQSNLHIHSGTTSSSTLRLSNNITTGASNRGANLRMLGGNLFISNEETTGNIGIITNGEERMNILSNGQVSIGTSTAAPGGKLHVHDDIVSQDVKILLTNYLTGPGNLRGGSIQFLDFDFILNNYEANGKVQINTGSGFNPRLTVDAAGNVGIGVTNPSAPVEIQNATSGTNFLMKVRNTGNGNGIISSIDNPALILPTNKVAIMGNSVDNNAIVGMAEGSGFAIHGYSASGRGVYGNSNNGYGVFGRAENASSPGGFFQNFSINGVALQIDGGIKVVGSSKPIFQITAVTGPGGNTSSNTLTIPNTTQANAATDLLIVTPVYVSVYLNKPIGVWWDGINWNIFTQDLSNMPNGAIFNVLVVKQ